MLFLRRFPTFIGKFTKVTIYFFPLIILHEFVEIGLNKWHLPQNGQYIGWVEIFDYSLPIEELLLFVVVTTTAILCYYEFFDDDRK